METRQPDGLAETEVQPKRSAIVDPQRTSIFGDAPDMTEEELRRRGDAADALFRKIVRRVRNEGTT